MDERLDLLSCESPLARPQLSSREAVGLEQLFGALADRHRLRVVSTLAQAGGQAICVCELQHALGLKQPTVSYHLKRLVEAGVIEREQRGRFAFYALCPGVLEWIGAVVRPREAVVEPAGAVP